MDMLVPGSISPWLPIIGQSKRQKSGWWVLPEVGTQALIVFTSHDYSKGFVAGFIYDQKHIPRFSDNFPNAPIISFITGTVWGIKWEKSYGNVLLIKDNHNFLYLLAHLEKINVIEDEDITPGKIVAFAGSTGSGGGNNPNNVHLHLEIFNINNQKKLNILGKENSLWNSSFDRWAARRNPLDNTQI